MNELKVLIDTNYNNYNDINFNKKVGTLGEYILKNELTGITFKYNGEIVELYITT